LDSAGAVFEKIDFKPGVISIQSEKGRLYLGRKQYSKANAQFRKALQMSRENKDDYIVIASYLDLGKVAFENNQLRLYRRYVDSAETVANKMPGFMFGSEIAMARTKILREEKRYGEAIEIMKDNIEKVKGENLRESEKSSYEELYKLYKDQGDMENSFQYFEKFTQLKDTLREELQNSRLNVLRVEHNYNELVADLETTEAELQIASESQKRIRLRNYFTIGIACLVIMFAIFVFFRQRKLNRVRRSVLESKQEILKVKQEALDNKVQFKNKQITDFAIHISEKNELLEKIKTKLKGIKVINDTYKEMVNDTLHFINNDIEQNREKIQLYQQVNETNDSFRAKIEQMYTTLSDKEKKVATMLRLGQTSKQIALQLNISAASVDNYRYTLRKKMNIPKGESLKMFIQNI
jgi:DNA-binding CsgD family transcriptional regulator